MKASLLKSLVVLSLLLLSPIRVHAEQATDTLTHGGVITITLNMPILPGAFSLLERSLAHAEATQAKALVIVLDTPGGILSTTQQMTQLLLRSKIPVIVFVGPSGASATSAGAFIVMAGHVAAMAPGTTIGAAHPVSGEGKDIQGDMRAKVENFTASMAKTISEQRGRNVEWAEKSVKESSSLTEKEALKLKVVDIVADNVDDLLKKLKGREIVNGKEKIVFEDLSLVPQQQLPMNFKEKALNFFADPNVAALLWLVATTAISIELYNPGAILPAVVGIICLILALTVSQTIPISAGALALIIAGAIMIGFEMYVASGLLGIGGIVAIVLGSLYLIDVTEAPGLAVSLELILPSALIMGLLMLLIVYTVARASKNRAITGKEGMVGMKGKAVDTISPSGSSTSSSPAGKVFINGEFWNAVTVSGLIAKDSLVEVVRVREGLILEVQIIKE